MNITTISTYSAEDETKIASGYAAADGSVDFDAIATAIQNNDSSVAAVEDLLSYYMDNKGDVPDMLVSSPDSVSYLWDDPEVMGTLQEWRRELPDYTSQMVTDLTTFLELGGQDVSTIADASAFIMENMMDGANGSMLEGFDDITNLVTDMVTIMMKMGNPGMALLAYVLGFDAVVNAEDVNPAGEGTQYALQESTAVPLGSDETAASAETLPAEYAAVDGEVVTTENTSEGVETDGIMGTADEVEGPQVAYVENSGLGDVVKDLQGTAIDVMTNAQDTWEDAIDRTADVDPEDPDAQQEIQLIQREIENIKKIITSMEEFIKMSQDILDSVIQTAGDLNEKQLQAVMRFSR